MQKNILKLFYVVCIIVLSSNSLLSQNTYTINAQIIDSLTSEQLDNTHILLVDDDSINAIVTYALTDSNGFFTIKDIVKGDYLLQISHLTHISKQIAIKITGNNSNIDFGKIGVVKNENMLNTVKIEDEKPLYSIDGEKTIYNVSQDPVVQSGTASDALNNAPGVEVDIEGNITLRGVSGVKIYINDKPSRLNQESLKLFIQQLPANSLESIEVITNPSAKYSVDGDQGVINLVLTSNIKKNTFVSFGFRQSTRPSSSPWVSYVYANKKLSLNVYLSGDFSKYNNTQYGFSTTLNENLDTSNIDSYNGESFSDKKSTSLFLSGSYDPDTINSFSFYMGGAGSLYNDNGISNQYRKEFIYNADEYNYVTSTFTKNIGVYSYGGFNFTHKFNNKGHRIDVELSPNLFYNSDTTSYTRDYNEHNTLDQNQTKKNKSIDFSISPSITYVLPLKKDREINIGGSMSNNNERNLKYVDTLNYNTDLFLIDSLRSFNSIGKDFNYKLYTTFKQKVGSFTYKLGLRAEYKTTSSSYDENGTYDLSKDYWGLFPSIHLSYKTKSMNYFKLSYTRRVKNPDASLLTDFITYYDDSYALGNPDLEQSYSNSIEAGWSKFSPKAGNISFSAYFKNSTNKINHLTDVAYSDIFGRMVSYSQPVNSGKTYKTGVDFSYTYRLKSFMNIRLYSDVYYENSELIFRDNSNITTENIAYNVRLRYWAKLWNKLEIHASANYRSRRKTIFTETEPSYYLNCGLRSDFFDRKLSVHLMVRDVFNWNIYNSNTTNPYYTQFSSYKYNSRYIVAGVTFRFGKMELENRAKSGENEE